MSNYNLQYKEYYDNLKKKNSTVNSERSINDDGILIYRGNTVYTQNRKHKKEGFFAKKPIFKNFKAKRIFLC